MLERAERFGVADLEPEQRAAVARPGGVERLLALERDGVGNDPPAGLQRLPATAEHPRGGNAPADEHRVGRLERGKRVGRRPFDHLERGDAQAQGIGVDSSNALVLALDRYRARPRLDAEPLDRDRSAARADVPQQLAGARAQHGERDRADRPFGQLAVVVVGAVGKARMAAENERVRRRDALDRDRV
jgi:hypothetical protein